MEDKMAEVLHEVDFKVPLSGSELFDIHTFVSICLMQITECHESPGNTARRG